MGGEVVGALPSLTEGGGSSSATVATQGAKEDDKLEVITVESSDRGVETADGTENWIPLHGTPQGLGLAGKGRHESKLTHGPTENPTWHRRLPHQRRPQGWQQSREN